MMIVELMLEEQDNSTEIIDLNEFEADPGVLSLVEIRSNDVV